LRDKYGRYTPKSRSIHEYPVYCDPTTLVPPQYFDWLEKVPLLKISNSRSFYLHITPDVVVDFYRLISQIQSADPEIPPVITRIFEELFRNYYFSKHSLSLNY
jgi:hypothetical protein